MPDLHIGIMSGTSLDGADAVLVDWNSRRCVAFATLPYTAALRQRLLSLSSSGPDELNQAGEVSIELTRVYADVVTEVLASANVRNQDVKSIGCHGQTVRHRPDRGFSIQLQNASLLAELTRITVVADFRSRDMAAGGQGAPLAPAFHDGIFRDQVKFRAVVNIGGISNLTVLAPGSAVSGFDCGPGNVLMDHWASAHLGVPFDEDGKWAQSGKVDPALLVRFLADPFFKLKPPKSTGRELFNVDWLARSLAGRTTKPRDVQATLLELTARAITDAIRVACPKCDEVIVCGGGARNSALMARIGELAGTHTAPSDELGIPSGQVEGMAFAWFAKCTLERRPISLQTITGSSHPVILGAIYPA